MAKKIEKENIFYDMIFQEIEKNSIKKYSSKYSSEYSLNSEEAEELFGKFHDLVTGKLKDANEIEALGKLAVFQGVQEFPARVKCASLAWHTLQVALNNTEEKISTE